MRRAPTELATPATYDLRAQNQTCDRHELARKTWSLIPNAVPHGWRHPHRTQSAFELRNLRVKEEQNDIFPKATRAKNDVVALCEKIMPRKQERMAEKGMEIDK